MRLLSKQRVSDQSDCTRITVDSKIARTIGKLKNLLIGKIKNLPTVPSLKELHNDNYNNCDVNFSTIYVKSYLVTVFFVLKFMFLD